MYFPTSGGVTFLITVSEGMMSVTKVDTSSIADSIRLCYFHFSHLMELEVPAEYLEVMNKTLKDSKFATLRRQGDK